MKPINCPVCSKKVTNAQKGVKCDGTCESWFHTRCVGMSEEFYRALSEPDALWLCRSCETLARDGSVIDPNNLFNGKKQKPDKSPTMLMETLSLSKIDVNKADVSNRDIAVSMNAMLCILMDMNKNIAYQSAVHDDLVVSNKKLQGQVDTISQTNTKLVEEHKNIQLRLSKMEQSQLDDECEINGFPETPNENISDIAIQISNVLKCPIAKTDISKIYRTKKAKTDNKARYSSIVVKFTSSETRDKLLASRKAHGKLSYCQLGLQGNHEVHINERLTYHNRNLLWLTRNAALALKYRYVWTKYGVVYMRKNEGSPILRILSPDDLPKK